uniref:Cell division control protein 45-like protein n=1 Tax=Syphacia muris TaxID=451379 RepID=A0A0N5AD41_9BILA
MLIRNNFRRQFYDVIKKEHVLLIAHNDVDALCTTQIFIHLFNSDDVAFSLVTVSGWESLNRAIEDNIEKYNVIVLVNCGGNRSLMDIPMPSTTKIFVIDSLRPFDLDNIFAEDNVRILVVEDELREMKIPAVKDIYASDSESDEDEESGEDTSKKDLEDVEARAMRRSQKQQWNKRRADLLWEYYEKSWYSAPSSILMLEVAHEIGKSCAELMWCAVVGLNSQLMDNLISLEAYTQVCIDRLRTFIRRFSPRDSALKADGILKISFDKDDEYYRLPLPMYSHWSLYKSMVNHEYFVCESRYWQQRGDHDMRTLLANLGLTLSECNQLFSAMCQERRTEVFQILMQKIDYSFASFTAIIDYCKRINACDLARVLSHKLEIGLNNESTIHERFMEGLNLLERFFRAHLGFGPVLKGIENYKISLEAVTSLVLVSINQSYILPCGPFFVLIIPQSEHVKLLSSRHFLLLFANFVLKAFCTMGRKNRAFRPLIIAVPLSEEEEEGWLKVTGIMPLNTVYADVYYKSFIGQAFERVAERLPNCGIKRDYFDPSIILLKSDDRIRFFDGLQAVLETVS